MGQTMGCCSCGPRTDALATPYDAKGILLPQVEDDSWKKHHVSGYTAAMLAEDQSYTPPRYVGQYQ
ncbi:hypothetical protein SPRG_11836 [Saprolegnia parasitica CBS 223.65]|uniref:Uncharacterized protein n=1 Tax=Saprolegnia parasitica (strain CBS 223.65) TaxID=695850 RepID=A0A067BWR9_SAPPC|nr:hypothetical protein SPRG_11836 [Saprolegnia parasitica CBS 223.65]KDO22989.1 hypothetical protein SPRG_11836 [Saprolegnia parasitica CBS 223.65]|eukprot:XP_012206280.1 hypothetical protein SPRG_11836 [Saprolegnia parasitica CBS 223.65]